MSELEIVLTDTAKELGCKPDNEEILFAIDIKNQRIAQLEYELAQAKKRIDELEFKIVEAAENELMFKGA